MNVLLTGASGFVGSHLARALRAAEYVVIEARRNVDDGTAAVRADFTRDLTVRDWLPKLAGVDAVINAVGIVREHGAQTFESIHKRAPQALFTACVAAGVRRIVQISALGADRGMTRYFLSKRAADDYLATLPLDWTIVRPALVFGPGASTAGLFTKLAQLPLVPLPGRGEQRVQPLHIDDLTEALVHLLTDSSTHRSRIELVGPQSFSFRELLVGLRRTQRLRPPRFLPVPMSIVRAAAHVAASPVDSETLALLEAGERGDPATIRQLLGRPPRPIDQGRFGSIPAGQ
jgi:Nucleoside-diphosphate-sugar epimerases